MEKISELQAQESLPKSTKAANSKDTKAEHHSSSSMKKMLYADKGKVHPSPAPPTTADRLCLLPATILTLTVALSPEDKEVLAYLISCSGTPNSFFGNREIGSGGGSGGDHPPEFLCDCFRCYMSYWVKWDNSPNRQLIHEILDEYEEGLFNRKKGVKGKKERRRRVKRDSVGEPESAEVSREVEVEVDNSGDCEVGSEKGSAVRKLVSFIGERIWGVWGI